MSDGTNDSENDVMVSITRIPIVELSVSDTSVTEGNNWGQSRINTIRSLTFVRGDDLLIIILPTLA